MHRPLALLVTALVLLHASAALGIWHYEPPEDNSFPLLDCWSNGSESYAVGEDGAAFHHKNDRWSRISDDTLASADLYAVHGIPSGTIYAAGSRLGPPRYDANNDGLLDSRDPESLYGVIFRYNGELWEEIFTGCNSKSPCFVSQYTGIWGDADHGLYFVGFNSGRPLENTVAPPAGVILSFDGAFFSPLSWSLGALPIINDIQGTETHAYLPCSYGIILELNRSSEVLSMMKSEGYMVDYLKIWKDDDATLYATAKTDYGSIFRYNPLSGWAPMGIDHSDVPPLHSIARHGTHLIAAGHYGKSYWLDTDQDVWKEMITGTQSHINALCTTDSGLLAATSSGKLYRMEEKDPDTAFIIAAPPTSLGIQGEGEMYAGVTLYDFSLGDIWKRTWHFNNGDHHDAVPSKGKIHSSTPSNEGTSLTITGQGGASSNRELRIVHCEGCPTRVEIEGAIIHLSIQSGETTQNAIKTVLEKSSAISEVQVSHGDSPWIITGNDYDSVMLKGGRDDEDLFVNEATAGADFNLANHLFKGGGTWNPSLTVHRENTVIIDGIIKITGRRDAPGTQIVIKDAGEIDLSTSATGSLNNVLTITAEPGSRGNITINLANDPDASEITSAFEGSTLTLIFKEGEATIQEVINHLEKQELIATALFTNGSELPITEASPWQMASMGHCVDLKNGKNHAVPILEGSTVTLTIDSGITTSTDMAMALSTVKTAGGENLFETQTLIAGKIWKTDERTNQVTLLGVSEETVTTDVRIYNQIALDFTYTPKDAETQATITFTDKSDPSLEIVEWSWDIFRNVSTGFETKASVTTRTGTAQATISDYGEFSIGLEATLKDGSTLTMQKDDVINIKGEHAGDHSYEGGSGCFIQSSGWR